MAQVRTYTDGDAVSQEVLAFANWSAVDIEIEVAAPTVYIEKRGDIVAVESEPHVTVGATYTENGLPNICWAELKSNIDGIACAATNVVLNMR